MTNQTDPIAEVIAQTITEVMRRGVSVQPEGNGWVIRLASDSDRDAQAVEPAEGTYLRSW